MFIQLSSAEEKLLKLIIENANPETKDFSISTQLLPPELRFYKEAMQSLISKGCVYKEIPVLRSIMGYVTDEGLSYFTEKEQNRQMKLLKGEARDLLIELIENKDSNLASLLAAKFEGLNFAEDNHLRTIIKYLIDNGYLLIPKNGWADNVPYFAQLTYEGSNYLKLEEEDLQRAAALQSSLTINNHGQLNVASDNATIIANQYNGIDLAEVGRLIDAVKSMANGLDSADLQSLDDSVELLKEELASSKPKASLLRMAINSLKGIKGTAEFAAAVVALVEFAQRVI